MAIVAVYHIDELSGGRVHIANVDAFPSMNTDAALEYAFERTQNVFGSWSKGPMLIDPVSEEEFENKDYSDDVEVMQPLRTHFGRYIGHRSSMVNDEFEIHGVLYRCEVFGFKPVYLPV